MKAVIYTRDDHEYTYLKQILQDEAKLIDVERDPLDGHGHYHEAYDLVIVAIDGAQGLQIVLDATNTHSEQQIIWITNDPYFVGIAMKMHIHDFIERPYGERRLRESIRKAIPKCPNRFIWRFRPQV